MVDVAFSVSLPVLDPVLEIGDDAFAGHGVARDRLDLVMDAGGGS